MASNINITRSGPEQMQDNPAQGTRRENADHATDYRPQPAYPHDWRVTAARFAGIGALALVVALILGLAYFFQCGLPWLLWYEDSATCAQWRATLGYAPRVAGLCLAVYLVYRLIFAWQGRAVEVQRGKAEVARFSLLPDRFGNPTPATLYDGLTPQERMQAYMAMLQLASDLKATTAPYETLPSGLNTYSPTNTSNHEMAMLEAAEQAPDVGPLAPAVWLGWLDRQPHALFAAKTGEGKSTIAKYGLKPRIDASEDVFVIDPHSSGWFALPGVGGGEDWHEVEAAMMCVYAEYKKRAAERERYRRETGEEMDDRHFPRLTVVFDEANNARTAFDRIYAGSKRRHNPWPLFAECLSSGARKLSISVWLLVQSALVEDLGLTGAMRQNFTRLALDHYTIRQMVNLEETDKARKEAIYAALPAQYPATAIVDNKVFLLDRQGINDIQPPRQSAACAWHGWDYRNRAPLVTLATPDEDDSGDVLARLMARPIPHTNGNGRAHGFVRPSDGLRTSVAVAEIPPITDGRTDGRVSQDKMRAYLKALATAGKSRDYARRWADAKGLQFENSLWTEVRKELGLG